MKRFALLVSLIAVAGISSADLRSETNAARAKVERAFRAKDIKGADAAYKDSVTTDFKYVAAGHTENIKGFLHDFDATIAMTDKVTSSSSRVMGLMQKGNSGSAQVERKMTGIMKTPDKKRHTFDWTGLFTEEYRKVGGKWKTASMIAGKQRFLMDGKTSKM